METQLKRLTLAILTIGLVGLLLTADTGLAQRAATPAMAPILAGATAPALMPAQEATMLIGRYCFRCHNDRDLTGGLTLESFDVANAFEHAEIAEKMIRKLEARMMPPRTAQRPDEATYEALVAALTSTIDADAAAMTLPPTVT